MRGVPGTGCGTEKAKDLATLPVKVMAIAGGEGVARIANLLLTVFVAREFGVRAAGAWALAQGLALYLIQGTDFGLRHVGARLAAQQPNAIAGVVRFIQRRRIALALAMCAAGYLYGRFGPVPEDTRELVSLFALATFGYGLSLDWLAWGTERFGRMSGWRAMVALVGAGLTAAGVLWLHWGVLCLTGWVCRCLPGGRSVAVARLGAKVVRRDPCSVGDCGSGLEVHGISGHCHAGESGVQLH